MLYLPVWLISLASGGVGTNGIIYIVLMLWCCWLQVCGDSMMDGIPGVWGDNFGVVRRPIRTETATTLEH